MGRFDGTDIALSPREATLLRIFTGLFLTYENVQNLLEARRSGRKPDELFYLPIVLRSVIAVTSSLDAGMKIWLLMSS